ncbi:MAG: class I SAM-dependent methyltransferase [Acidimicrobiia bacterium]
MSSAPRSGAAAPADDWEQHWTEYAESAGLNPAQRYRQRLIVRALRQSGTPTRILDIGSGQGDLLAVLGREWPQAELAGVELSASGVECARSKMPSAQFVQRNLLEAHEPPAGLEHWASHGVCSEVLEHVDEPRELLRNAGAFLGPGAGLVVTVPAGPRSAFDRHIGHRRHYTSAQLSDLLQSAGFACTSVHRAGFPFFQLYRLVVILRGRRLVDDVAASPDGAASPTAAALMRAFDTLFHANLDHAPWGWQLVATAKVLDSSS